MRHPDPAESAGDNAGGAPLLEVEDLYTRFDTRRGAVHAVNGVSFRLERGGSLALVGESGSGKSVSALSTLGLVPPPGRIVSGAIRLRGRDLTRLDPREWGRIRGREIAMIFQDPMTSLNPVLPVGRQIDEVLRHHLGMDREGARAETGRLLTRVGIPDADRRRGDAPHTFSGGQRQRIMIAMALACRPSVLIADEPTTALDVTVQAQIVALVRELQDELGMAVLWITHDLALVAGIVDRVAVLYAGTIVEEAPVDVLFRNPRHPYTRGLMGALPSVEVGSGRPGPGDEGIEGPDADATGSASLAEAPTDGARRGARTRLAPVEGQPPVLREAPASCPFAPRCPRVSSRCREERPALRPVPDPEATGHPGSATPAPPGRHRAACWHQEDRP